MIANNDCDEIAMVRCRKCGDDFHEAELIKGLCPICADLMQRKQNKKEGRRDDDRSRDHNDV